MRNRVIKEGWMNQRWLDKIIYDAGPYSHFIIPAIYEKSGNKMFGWRGKETDKQVRVIIEEI